MLTMLQPILGTLDTKVLIMFGTVTGICLIACLVKKVFKAAIFLAIFTAGAIMLYPIVVEFQEDYKISVEGGTIEVTVKGETYTIDRSSCKSILLENKGSKGYKLEVIDTNSKLDIIIPRFMTDTFIEFCDRYNIKLTVRD